MQLSLAGSGPMVLGVPKTLCCAGGLLFEASLQQAVYVIEITDFGCTQNRLLWRGFVKCSLLRGVSVIEINYFGGTKIICREEGPLFEASLQQAVSVIEINDLGSTQNSLLCGGVIYSRPVASCICNRDK